MIYLAMNKVDVLSLSSQDTGTSYKNRHEVCCLHARPECTFCFLGTWHLRNTKSLGTVLLCLSQNWSPFHNKTSYLKGNLLCYFCFLFVPPFLVEVSTDSIPNIPYYNIIFFPWNAAKYINYYLSCVFPKSLGKSNLLLLCFVFIA